MSALAKAPSKSPASMAQTPESAAPAPPAMDPAMGNAAQIESLGLSEAEEEPSNLGLDEEAVDDGAGKEEVIVTCFANDETGGSDHYAGEKALANANASWQGTSDVKTSVEMNGFAYRPVLDTFDMTFKYWLNANNQWDDIANFPGGAYDPNFNTKEGSMAHEEAEIEKVHGFWREAGAKFESDLGHSTFVSRQLAEEYIQHAGMSAYKPYWDRMNAVRKHTDTVGPDAEWAYYKAHAK